MFQANRKGVQVTAGSRTFVSSSAEETLGIGRQLGETLRGGEIILLTGSLGAGKSVLARGVADGLKIRRWRGSPTFALVHEYDSTPMLIHADFYRLEPGEVEELGFEDYASAGTVVLVEWADRAPELLAALPFSRRIRIYLEHRAEDERELTIAEEHWAANGLVQC